ncbi:MAG: hypothetical protein KME43_10775 [Myxacorys chilensis ATA2-1-KO14]|jgi:hypothetical protein|nr:hypothetical protein [Myxacorys chilensis ATA2-1-KO14]
MDFARRQQQIIDRLRPKPVHHGQLETILIAVPNLSPEDIAPERSQVLRDSLVQEGSNLVPLIVRRTEAYADEEYEVIYGADWCLVARELDIQRLWVWVFDLNDEQAAVTRLEMELLLGNSATSTSASPPDEIQQISALIQRSEQSLERKISQHFNSLFQHLEQSLPPFDEIQQISILIRELEQSLERKMSQQLDDLLKHLEQSFETKISQQMNVLFERLEQSLEQKISHQIAEAMNSAIVELKQSTSSHRKPATLSGSPYSKMKVAELKQLARERQLEVPSRPLKQELIDLLIKADEQTSG